MFGNLGTSNYTFFVTSENSVGTAFNTSKVFVPSHHDCKYHHEKNRGLVLGALIQGRWYVHILILLTSMCSLYRSLGMCMYQPPNSLYR